MNNKKFIFSNTAFIVVLAAGAFCGYGMRNYSPVIAASVGVFICFSAMFIGMILAYMEVREHKKSTDKHNKELAVRAADVVANKVANRLLARYVSGLDNEAFRANVFKCVSDTIAEELDTLRQTYDEAPDKA